MAIVQGVLRHSWISSCLITGAVLVSGCGSRMSASRTPPQLETEPSYAASSPEAHGAQAPSHAAVDLGGDTVAEAAPERPGLGTAWGEEVEAPISFAPFVRASSAPWAEVALHYNDEDGVGAHAAYLGTRPAPLEVVAGDGALSIALVDEQGQPLPGYAAGGRTLVLGEDGARYRIVVRNATSARFEVVASVDGLDVIDGRPADPARRGYLVGPYDQLVIEGFRTSDDAVAAFRFGKVAESYAAQTSGDRNVGVIGLAMFAERGARWTPAELGRRDTADPFPHRGYATPPR